MPIQLPSRTADQVQDILKGVTVNSLYPYSFRINRTYTSPNFPNSDSAGGGNFVQFVWTPSVSLALVISEGTMLQVSGGPFVTATQLSLSPVMTLSDSSNLSAPTDEANIIYQGIFSNTSTILEHRYLPENYYLYANTPVYVSFWVQSGAIGQAGSVIGNLILHVIPLGLGS